MTELADLKQLLEGLQNHLTEISSKLSDANQSVKTISDENAKLRRDVELMKSTINRQATAIANLDSEIDDLGQYGRRENIVFTNLHVSPSQSPESQVIEFCKHLDVTVDKSDIAACHPLPTQGDKPKRIIARFHSRSTAQKIFVNRKKAKLITPDNKDKLAADNKRGFWNPAKSDDQKR